ncbi:MAG: hypothetical protein ACT4O3_06440 [Elusimicrobiota bacterium]
MAEAKAEKEAEKPRPATETKDAAPPPPPAQDWRKEKESLQRSVKEAQERARLAEERLSMAMKHMGGDIVVPDGPPEAVRELEKALALEKAKAGVLEQKAAALKAELEKLRGDPGNGGRGGTVSPELIALRDEAMHLRQDRANLQRELQRTKELLDAESKARLQAGDEKQRLSQRLDILETGEQPDRARRLEEAQKDLKAAEARLEQETQARKRAEDEKQKLAQKLSLLQAAMKEELAHAAQELAAAESKHSSAPAAGSDDKKLLEEIDTLLAENAGLQDEIRFLRGKAGLRS